MERIIRAAINSWRGWLAAFRSEAAFRQETILLVLAIPAACGLTPDPWKRLLLIGVLLIVMAAELLNTAIEKLADFLTLEHNALIGRIKDMGSGAVTMAILMAAATWLLALKEFVWG